MENNINFVEYSPDQLHANVIVTELLLKVGVDLKETRAPQRFGFRDFDGFARTMGYI